MRTIPKEALTAAAAVAGRDKGRYVLNGVQIAETETGTRVVGCDGRRLVMVECPSEHETFPAIPGLDKSRNGATSIILGAAELHDAIRAMPKARKSGPDCAGHVAIVADENSAQIAGTDLARAQVETIKGMDGLFPDHEQIIPKTPPIGRWGINPDYMISVLKALKPFAGPHGECVTMEYRGAGHAFVVRGEGPDGKAVAVVMPILIDNPIPPTK